MMTVKVGRRGQITLPREIRRQLGVEEGDQVAFITEGDRIVLQPLTQSLLDLRGCIAVKKPQDFEEIRRKVLADRGKKAAGHES